MLSRSKIEYVGHGVNWRTGCAHDCAYCYMAGMARRFDQLAPESGKWSESECRVADPADALIQELLGKATLPQGTLLISTAHDPAMDNKCADESVDVVAALAAVGLVHRTLYLTKAPNRALDALRAIGADEGLRFGASITSLGRWLTETYEPNAEMPEARLAGLVRANAMGYVTWVSLEPPLPDVYLRKLVEVVLDLPGQPWVVLGKLNMRGPASGDAAIDELRRWAKSDHWSQDRDEAVARLEAAGYAASLEPIDGGYWVKKELRELD
jgi:DNA repair photolyase